MTHAEIDALPAGRELDALVAERVMGWLKVEPAVNYDVAYGCPPGFGKRAADRREFCPRYSRDIAAAWEVVDKTDGSGPRGSWWWALETKWRDPNYTARLFEGSVEVARGEAWTMPLAICRAALKAGGA